MKLKQVFVVDDEKLVRQGIITTFPWSKYGFQVVGEASSGEQALERMEDAEVDLLVTDVTMPGMSGLELIRRAREARPHLPAVVLTCHDSFDYIQTSMRLGVVDYIVKTEIVDELIDATLLRIAEKLGTDAGAAARRPDGDRGAGVGEAHAEEGLLLCRRTERRDPASGAGRLPHALAGADGALEIDRRTWLLAYPSAAEGERGHEEASRVLSPREWVVVRVRGIPGAIDEELAGKLRRYRWRYLFYAYREDAPVAPVDADRLPALAPEEPCPAPEAWEDPTWVNDDAAFERLLRATGGGAVDPTGLKNLFYHIALEWDRLLALAELPKLMDASEEFLFWVDWERWLRGFREALRGKLSRNATGGIHDAIMRAVAFVRQAEDLDLNEAEVARQVSMSRGYFSTCFKKVTGQSFGDYLKQVKLEKARLLILRTDDSITLTAEKCGFRDYRYFSRVFREYTGMLPNEYRKSGGAGKR
ncbi:response regulator [Paenibacillus sp.]|uniref:response regulator n=1 Tax=Paenibacillus sp. TaxID=58172 RepID=UPI002D456848|nr:response regulator [Paenibacillus sp.]HZG57545.1 response regulator [Paenibacillus sp.]